MTCIHVYKAGRAGRHTRPYGNLTAIYNRVEVCTNGREGKIGK